jgi:hypothetical protein
MPREPPEKLATGDSALVGGRDLQDEEAYLPSVQGAGEKRIIVQSANLPLIWKS